jgi:hypothetical protein
LFQRPVYSASDLQFDLTQPYVQAMLQIAQALSPQGRTPGLSAYFFNLTWDYSSPLIIPNVSVPTVSGLTVNPTTQQLSWNIGNGNPSGFRIEMIDPVTGITQYRTTLGHSHNTQGVTQYRLEAADYTNNRIIVVTPFDEQGDGTPSSIFNPASAGASIAGSPVVGSSQLGDIIRFNVNGDNNWDAVNYAEPMSFIYPVWGGTPIGTGPMAQTTSGITFVGPIASIDPTATVGAGGSYGSTSAVGSVNLLGGMKSGNNGNNSQFGMLAFYRWGQKFSINTITGCRFWVGLACWNSTSARGSNASDILSTNVYASDTPNKTTLGFRYSAGTDTHWQAVAITAAGGQTTIDTGITPDLNIHLFEMATNITGTAVVYLIDGIIVATITTNLPIPSQRADSWGELFFTVDNKNTATAVQLNFYSVQISHK